MTFLGERLKEEREKIGFSQTQLAAIGETTKKSQIDYEKGNSYPKGNYLESIAKVGVDVLYVVTGQRNQPLSNEEIMLLESWRNADFMAKHEALKRLSGDASDMAGAHKYQQTNHGGGNAQGDGAIGQVINNHDGQSTISVGTNHGQVAGKIHNH